MRKLKSDLKKFEQQGFDGLQKEIEGLKAQLKAKNQALQDATDHHAAVQSNCMKREVEADGLVSSAEKRERDAYACADGNYKVEDFFKIH